MSADSIVLRTTLKPGDIGTVIHLHGVIHADECGFGPTFECYVATPLAEFVHRASPRERLWLAEQDGCVVGCIAIVAASEDTAQLRWFLVTPEARRAGLGRRLVEEAIGFSRSRGYKAIMLMTVSALTDAARLYEAMGFVKVDAKPGRMGGINVIEEMYELGLS